MIRSEVEANSNHACDIIGLVTYVGRVERIRSKEKSGIVFDWTALCRSLDMFDFTCVINAPLVKLLKLFIPISAEIEQFYPTHKQMSFIYLCLCQDLRNSGRIGGYMRWMGQVNIPLSWRSFLHPSQRSLTISALVKHHSMSLSSTFAKFPLLVVSPYLSFSLVTYLVCTQMRVCQEVGRFVYLTSSTETQLFITGEFQSEHAVDLWKDNSCRTQTIIALLWGKLHLLLKNVKVNFHLSLLSLSKGKCWITAHDFGILQY